MEICSFSVRLCSMHASIVVTLRFVLFRLVSSEPLAFLASFRTFCLSPCRPWILSIRAGGGVQGVGRGVGGLDALRESPIRPLMTHRVLVSLSYLSAPNPGLSLSTDTHMTTTTNPPPLLPPLFSSPSSPPPTPIPTVLWYPRCLHTFPHLLTHTDPLSVPTLMAPPLVA